MNEIRSRHLVERAALRLREELGLQAGTAGLPAADAVRTLPEHEPPAPPAAASPVRLPSGPPPALPIGGAAGPTGAPAAKVPGLTRRTLGAGEAVPMDRLQGAGLTLGGRSRSRITEEFSVTAGALLRGLRAAGREAPVSAQVDEPGGKAASAFGNLMLVTSAKPGEGKTFSALNLAATLAHNGLTRVVLVDIDSKPASLTALLGLDGRPGLFDIASDPLLKPDDVVVGTAVRDLSILPLGTRDGAPGHGLARKIAVAIERIARRLSGQVIILDAPPCLATSEPSALAPIVGLVAMVVEAERTQRAELESALDMVATCPTVMLVLNKLSGGRGQAFGYYDYYGT